MIIYRHPSAVTPPDLAGWAERPEVGVCLHMQRHADAQHVGVCAPEYWDPSRADGWRDLADGWQGATTDGDPWDPATHLARIGAWCGVRAVVDSRGRAWLAPVIMTASGGRAYPVAYAGADFLPAPTPEQAKAEAICAEARRALLAAADGPGLPVSAACRWCAVLLSITHHLSPATIAALGLLDDQLVQRVLLVATGLDRADHA